MNTLNVESILSWYMISSYLIDYSFCFNGGRWWRRHATDPSRCRQTVWTRLMPHDGRWITEVAKWNSKCHGRKQEMATACQGKGRKFSQLRILLSEMNILLYHYLYHYCWYSWRILVSHLHWRLSGVRLTTETLANGSTDLFIEEGSESDLRRCTSWGLKQTLIKWFVCLKIGKVIFIYVSIG